MLDALIIKKLLHLSVLELGSIVTTHFLDLEAEFPLCSSNEGFHLILHLCLIIHEKHPSETSKVINNN